MTRNVLKKYKYIQICLLGCDTIQSGKWVPTFHRHLLCPFSGLNIPEDGGSRLLQNAGAYLSNSITFHKAVIFIIFTIRISISH
jgi:hypothetical protein